MPKSQNEQNQLFNPLKKMLTEAKTCSVSINFTVKQVGIAKFYK